ncbi:hypothetical protein BYT27DRAFT_7204781 [Phlegmacium glaucopus]|nr:hypothetical protein BYT27DRAFT_7204781 [Phlegmacium glaucopus]
MTTFQSKLTGQYIVSERQDVDDSVVRTIPEQQSIPDLTVFLTVTPPVEGLATIATIQGFSLYIAYKGDLDIVKPATWSDKEYKWVIRKTAQDSYVITPADGQDLYLVVVAGNAEVVSSSSSLKVFIGQLYRFHLRSLPSLARTSWPPRTSGLW